MAGLAVQLARVQEGASRHFTIEALASVLDPTWVAEALREHGVATVRYRKLPAELVTWLVIGMGLFRQLSITNVLGFLAGGLGFLVPWGPGRQKPPTSRAVTQARDRLGFEPLRWLFRRLAEFLGVELAPQHTWKGLKTYALDATAFKAPDTPENEARFGRPKASRGRSAFPQFRCVAAMAAWSHVVLAAAFGPWAVGELSLAAYLLPQIEPGALVLMDRGYYAYAWIASLLDKKVHFVIRAKTGYRAMHPAKRKRLGPRDWLADLFVPRSALHKSPTLPPALRVRVVTYHRKGFRPAMLVTSLLDPAAYPAEEIVALYHGRWEVELGYDELKTHQARTRVVFRSMRPERVLQEAYGLLIAYNCVRALMARAAQRAGVQPNRLSFTDCLERIRAALHEMSLAPGRRLLEIYERLLGDLARCVLPPRRSDRRVPRAVKVKMSNFPLKANQTGRGRRPRRRAA